jgi:lambda repressor-like predicted transcriptional regulator
MDNTPCEKYFRSKSKVHDEDVISIVSKLLKADPDPDGQNCKWIIDVYLRKEDNFILDQDVSTLKEDIIKYRYLYGDSKLLPKKGYMEMKKMIQKKLDTKTKKSLTKSLNPKSPTKYSGDIIKTIKGKLVDKDKKVYDKAYKAYSYAIIIGRPFPIGEDEISKVSQFALQYAVNILKGPFPKGEDAISKDIYDAYWYAKDALKGPFPKGEDLISKDPEYAYKYAEKVLKGPFPKGEDMISKDPEYAYKYAENVLKGSFPKGEEAISKDGIESYKYAKYVLKAPFPKGEDMISKDPFFAFDYAVYILNSPFPKGEEAISKDTKYSSMYNDFKKAFLKNRETEKQKRIEKIKTTPTLAFIYQFFHTDNYKYLPKAYKMMRDLNIQQDYYNTFDYQDTLDCVSDLEHPKWNVVKHFIDLLKVVNQEQYNVNIDSDFLFDLFKLEARILKTGSISILHAKNPGFLVLDIISQLISGSYEGYKPKCARNENNPKQKALSIYKDLNFIDWNDQITRNDSTPDIRAREISTNITILDNSFIDGESTLDFLFKSGSIGVPTYLISDLKLSKSTTLNIVKLTNRLNKIGNNLLSIYSFPLSTIDTYVYPSIAFGYSLNGYDIYEFLESYLTNQPWRENFKYYYKSQTRIVDLCFTKYAYEDGVRIYQMIDAEQDQLEQYLKEIEKIVISDKELVEKIKERIDLNSPKRKNPLRTIRSYSSTVKGKPKTNFMKNIIELKNVLGSERIPYVEKKIKKQKDTNLAAKYAYNYGKEILNNNWNNDLEDLIVKDPEYSYMYARDLIKGPWVKGEDAILKNPEWSYKYAKNVIKGPWIKAEDTISKNPEWSYKYAKNVINGPFPKGEQVIYNDPTYKDLYEKLFLSKKA